MADATSRFAYQACKTFQDVSVHGSAEAREEAKRSIAEELAEARTVGMICRNWEPSENLGSRNALLVGGTVTKVGELNPGRVYVVTRSGAGDGEHKRSESPSPPILEDSSCSSASEPQHTTSPNPSGGEEGLVQEQPLNPEADPLQPADPQAVQK